MNKKETASTLSLSSRIAFTNNTNSNKLVNDNFDQFDIKITVKTKNDDLIENFFAIFLDKLKLQLTKFFLKNKYFFRYKKNNGCKKKEI